MKISGHKTRSVFDRYNIVNKDDFIDAAKKLDAYNSEARSHSLAIVAPFSAVSSKKEKSSLAVSR